uniref:USP domain-containing protein n=1 Tax=Caenorhabditis tropicalis TaxID=1561998 RepID=A0A1I7U050_9PELO
MASPESDNAAVQKMDVPVVEESDQKQTRLGRLLAVLRGRKRRSISAVRPEVITKQHWDEIGWETATITDIDMYISQLNKNPAVKDYRGGYGPRFDALESFVAEFFSPECVSAILNLYTLEEPAVRFKRQKQQDAEDFYRVFTEQYFEENIGNVAYEQRCQCLKCGNVSVTTQEFVRLSLEHEDVKKKKLVTIREMVEHTAEPTIVERDCLICRGHLVDDGERIFRLDTEKSLHRLKPYFVFYFKK